MMGKEFIDDDYEALLAQHRVKRKLMREILRRQSEIKPCLGFRFTPEEERRIRMAILSAKIFMESYGKLTGIYANDESKLMLTGDES